LRFSWQNRGDIRNADLHPKSESYAQYCGYN